MLKDFKGHAREIFEEGGLHKAIGKRAIEAALEGEMTHHFGYPPHNPSGRKALAHWLSNTLDLSFCVEAMQKAIARCSAPKVFNTDQGAQFTSEAFTGVLKAHGVRISMDGKGRWLGNVYVERLWRSLKQEEVYRCACETVSEARKEIAEYLCYLQRRTPHQGLDNRTPEYVFYPAETACQSDLIRPDSTLKSTKKLSGFLRTISYP